MGSAPFCLVEGMGGVQALPAHAWIGGGREACPVPGIFACMDSATRVAAGIVYTSWAWQLSADTIANLPIWHIHDLASRCRISAVATVGQAAHPVLTPHACLLYRTSQASWEVAQDYRAPALRSMNPLLLT